MRGVLGNDLGLGTAKNGKAPVALTAEQRATHLYICGSTGTGKSKLLESAVRQDIANWHRSKCGMLVVDPHGSLYDDILHWLAWKKPAVPIVPIDLRQDDWIIGYNVLRQRPKSDPAVLINGFVQAMAHVWGEAGTQNTPQFARWAPNILGALYANGLTLAEAHFLTDSLGKRKRGELTSNLKHPQLVNDWIFADLLKPEDFDTRVASTVNRMRTFLATEKLRLMFGQTARSLDFGRALDEGHVILVNLATEKNRISHEDGAVLATLFLEDLWAAARERGKGTKARPVKPFYVYCDEFQKFVTPTMAQNLDEARGFGLHLTLANQFPRQILHSGPHGEQVYESVMANARSKIVFETRGEENLRPLALDLFMGVLDPDKVKHEIHTTKILGFDEETREVRSRSTSSGRGQGTHAGSARGAGLGGTQGFRGEDTNSDPMSSSLSESQFAAESSSSVSSESESESESVAEVPFLVPQFGKELSSRQYESLDEQIHRAMAALHDQPQRHCFVRGVGMKAPIVLETPFVDEMPWSEDRTRRYLESCYTNPAIRCAVRTSTARRQLEERTEKLRSSGGLGLSEPTTSRRQI